MPSPNSDSTNSKDPLLEEPQREVEVVEYSKESRTIRNDQVVVEEPVEIRIVFGPTEKRVMRNVSITMRTPGNDFELAAGFLMTESIITSSTQIENFRTLGVDQDGINTGNIVRVDVRPNVELEIGRLQRNFFTTSSCGVCGKASLEALQVQGQRPIKNDGLRIHSDLIKKMPDDLLKLQKTFGKTGGLHGAGLAGSDGQVVASREDVGRHNAVDKLVGRFFLDGKTPLSKYVMIVSGRVSFEIMQKALVAGLPMIVAVGAPSSLAIDLAKEYNITLIGFASKDRFNVYSCPERIH